jgi:hypothetical protein
MQDSTYRNASPPTPPSAHWPGDEELAAYIDGKLGKAESRRIERHLATCEDCYAVFAGTVQFQLESEQEPEVGKVVPGPSKEGMRNPWWSRIAALLVIGAGIGSVGYSSLSSPPPLVTAAVTEPIQGKPGLTGSLWNGPRERGGGEDEPTTTPVSEAAFRVGVEIVNLQVSLHAGDRVNAKDSGAFILQALDGQIGVGDLGKAYGERIIGAVQRGTPPRELLGVASTLSQESREILGTQDVDLGQWVEAGRLAAIAEEPSFFRQGRNRAFLRRLLWRQKLGVGEMEIDPAALKSLRDIADVLGKGSLGPSDYAGLQRSFEAILNVYYPQS